MSHEESDFEPDAFLDRQLMKFITDGGRNAVDLRNTQDQPRSRVQDGLKSVEKISNIHSTLRGHRYNDRLSLCTTNLARHLHGQPTFHQSRRSGRHRSNIHHDGKAEIEFSSNHFRASFNSCVIQRRFMHRRCYLQTRFISNYTTFHRRIGIFRTAAVHFIVS